MNCLDLIISLKADADKNEYTIYKINNNIKFQHILFYFNKKCYF